MNYGLLAIYTLVFIGLLVAANQHGQERPPVNFRTRLISTIISLILIWWATGWKLI